MEQAIKTESQQTLIETIENLKRELQIKEKQITKYEQDIQGLETLIGSVAHDLRNPLGVINTALYNIKVKRTNPGIDKHINNIEKKIFTSNHIITNLLIYMRLKPPTLESLSAPNAIQESIQAVQNYLQNFSITFRCKIPESLTVKADKTQFKQLIGNILMNAIDSYPDASGEVTISALDKDNHIDILIEDYGIGIQQSEIPRIFDYNYSSKSKGAGLGLAIVKKIINLHNGNIKIESKLNEGTKVYISFQK